MYKDMEWLIFVTVRQFSVLWDFFEKEIQKILAAPLAPIVITPAEIFITRADIDMSWCYVKRLC